MSQFRVQVETEVKIHVFGGQRDAGKNISDFFSSPFTLVFKVDLINQIKKSSFTLYTQKIKIVI